MRILLISRYNPSHPSVAKERLLSFYEAFEKAGHEPLWLTTKEAKGEYNYLRISYPLALPETSSQRSSLEEKKWLKPLLTLYRSRLNERLPSPLYFWSRNAKAALKGLKSAGAKFDLIIASYGPPAALEIGVFAKDLFGAKLVLDFRDLWAGNHAYKGLFPFTLLERWLEKQYVKKADLLTTVSEGLRETLEKRYPKKSVGVVYNGYVEKELSREVLLGAVYTGTLYDQGNQIVPFLEAASALRVDVFGTASEKTRELLKRHGAHFHPYCSPKEARERQSEAKFLLLFDFNHTQAGLLGVKVFEYLASERPILAIGVKKESELGKLLEKAGGVIFTENRREEIEKALKRIPEKADRDRSFTQQFERKKQAELLLNLIVSTLFPHNASPIAAKTLAKEGGGE